MCCSSTTAALNAVAASGTSFAIVIVTAVLQRRHDTCRSNTRLTICYEQVFAPYVIDYLP